MEINVALNMQARPVVELYACDRLDYEPITTNYPCWTRVNEADTSQRPETADQTQISIYKRSFRTWEVQGR